MREVSEAEPDEKAFTAQEPAGDLLDGEPPIPQLPGLLPQLFPPPDLGRQPLPGVIQDARVVADQELGLQGQNPAQGADVLPDVLDTPEIADPLVDVDIP